MLLKCRAPKFEMLPMPLRMKDKKKGEVSVFLMSLILYTIISF